MRNSGGGFAAVTDDEIVDGMRLLARTEGIFAETAGGVTIATLQKLAADGVIRADERVVVYITGHGLKTHRSGRADHAARPRRSRRRSTRSTTRSTSRSLRRHGVTVRIPTQLRSLSGGASEVSVEAATVADALKALDARTPGFAERLFDDTGELRRFVNVFVADEDIRFLQGVDTARRPTAHVVSIVPAVAGG